MLSIKPTLIIDLLSTFWVIAIIISLFIWLPIKSATANKQSIDKIQILGLWLRTISFMLPITLGLSYIGLLNWLTATLLYAGCLVLNYLKSDRWQIEHYRKIVRQKVINLADFLDCGLSLGDAWQKVTLACQKTVGKTANYLINSINSQGIVFVSILTAILILTFLLRWEYPMSDLRFSNPDRYSTLLVTRQLLAKNYPELDYFPVFSVLAAIVSLLGSIEPMQTIRFLSPVMGVILVICVGYSLKIFTNNANSALVGMLTLGGYLFNWQEAIDAEPLWLNTIISSLDRSLVRQWTGNELELGTIFLLLGLIYSFGSSDRHRKTVTFRINLLCVVVLIAISAPPLLIIAAIACIGTIGDKQLTLTAITLTWILLAIFAAIAWGKIIWMQSFLITLPIPLSLLSGLLFISVGNVSTKIFARRAEFFCLGLIVALTLNFWLPSSPKITYLEYDLAARKSLEIKRIFPAKTWTLVAPVEQLAEIYGSGWYEDLAAFVDLYRTKAKNPQFNFATAEQDLFIMVEKVPFVTFPNEPDILPDEILSDRTYRYYRSSAGRASLEYEALQVCEAYRSHHPRSSDIYYEDNELRIYHFFNASSG